MGADVGQHLVATSDAAIDLGSTAARWRAVYARDIQARGTPAGTEGTVQLFSQSATARAQAEFWRARDTAGAPSAVSSGDSLGEVGFYGHDGSAYQQGAFIRSPTDGTIAAGRMPSRIEFGTAPDSVSAPTTRWRMMPSGILQPGADNTYDVGTSAVRVKDAYAYNVDVATALRAGSDSAVDIGATATRFRHVYTDQWVAVAPATGISIASTSAQTIASKSVEGLAAGDSLYVDARFLYVNNSGGVRTFTFDLTLNGVCLLSFTSAASIASSVDSWVARLQGTFAIISTSLTRSHGVWDIAFAAGAAGATAAPATGNMLHMFGWNTSATNLTGTQTLLLTGRSNTATGTQTVDLLGFRVDRVRA